MYRTLHPRTSANSRPAPPACTLPSLLDATQSDLQTGLERGCFSSVELVTAYLGRINEVNSELNAVLEVNPDSLRIAEELDIERRQGSTRGPLHGLPILVKDLIGTEDLMETAAGSYALVGSKVREDATVVKKLRDSGAIILGKTSMSEWANTRSRHASNGWNARGGQTYAAYHERQDPLGSSSGSAVATDLSLTFAALGTETRGSIILPSEKSNIVGIKPTVGLTSRHVAIPISERADTIGPMARTVRDAAMVLQAIVGKDEKDNYTLAAPFSDNYPDYVAACNPAGLQGKRIGIPRNVIETLPITLPGATGPIVSSFERAVAVLKKAGATIVEDANFTSYDDYRSSVAPAQVLAADMLSGLRSYLSALSSNPNNLQGLSDIRDFTQRSPEEDYPARDTDLWDMALIAGMDNTSPGFLPLYQQALYLGEEGGLLGALSRDSLDAVILPTYLAGDIPGIIGSPVITVPFEAFPADISVQFNERGDLVNVAPGIPLGISFMGPKWSEESLIGMAYAFEQETLSRGNLRRAVESRMELKDVQDILRKRTSCLPN
ncbi:amidase signature domain-containing protein [Aspergillus pseudoustus]|uniref:Amidase signature domain-containing protein n=1 Tax=Aspergillus pseudoustus TaxID=1810923 RepID=A0ABR4JP83_9EURO